MDTLYITDLDGTLLNKEAKLSDFSLNTLSRLIERGMNFTIASGRTPLSVFEILKNVPLKLPIILMNGVLVFNPQSKEIIHGEPFSPGSLECLLEVERRLDIGSLLFRGNKGKVDLTMTTKWSSFWENFFIRNSASKSISLIKQVSRENLKKAEIFYGIYIDNKGEKLEELKHELGKYSYFTLDFYKDMYHNNTWCLEVYNIAASKEKATQQVRQLTGAKYIIGFGDNLNDLSLFHACEECYAVANGKPEVKTAAHGIIGHHDEDGVARYLEQIWENSHVL